MRKNFVHFWKEREKQSQLTSPTVPTFAPLTQNAHTTHGPTKMRVPAFSRPVQHTCHKQSAYLTTMWFVVLKKFNGIQRTGPLTAILLVIISNPNTLKQRIVDQLA
jgi:hypothetical protein